jgi:hypothetical protein
VNGGIAGTVEWLGIQPLVMEGLGGRIEVFQAIKGCGGGGSRDKLQKTEGWDHWIRIFGQWGWGLESGVVCGRGRVDSGADHGQRWNQTDQ